MMFDGGRRCRILEYDHACAHRNIELLVGVKGDGIGKLYAAQKFTVGFREQGRPAPGSIYVEVTSQFRGEPGKLIKRVDVTGFGCTGNADDTEGKNPFTAQSTAVFL